MLFMLMAKIKEKEYTISTHKNRSLLGRIIYPGYKTFTRLYHSLCSLFLAGYIFIPGDQGGEGKGGEGLDKQSCLGYTLIVWALGRGHFCYPIITGHVVIRINISWGSMLPHHICLTCIQREVRHSFFLWFGKI